MVTDVLEIANTRHGPGAELDEHWPGDDEHDHLAVAEEARAYLASRGLSVPANAPAEEELDHLREVREVVQAMTTASDSTLRRRLQQILPRYNYQLSPDGALVPLGSGWDRLVGAAMPGLFGLLAARDRLRRCGNPECGWLFVDRSRNHSRQWCDMGTCGSRAKMARYRRRRREARA